MEIDNCDPYYEIQFEDKHSSMLSKRKYKHVKAYSGQNSRSYCLCRECNMYLDGDRQLNAESEFGWCSYVWYLLSNEEIHEVYGSAIWRYIPMKWRPWWLSAIQIEFPAIFNDVSIDSPSPGFVDKTLDIKEWKSDINSFALARLEAASNKFLQPIVKCPWGCSEFLHKAGHIPFDVMIQRVLQRCDLKTITKNFNTHYRKVSKIFIVSVYFFMLFHLF